MFTSSRQGSIWFSRLSSTSICWSVRETRQGTRRTGDIQGSGREVGHQATPHGECRVPWDQTVRRVHEGGGACQ